MKDQKGGRGGNGEKDRRGGGDKNLRRKGKNKGGKALLHPEHGFWLRTGKGDGGSENIILSFWVWLGFLVEKNKKKKIIKGK